MCGGYCSFGGVGFLREMRGKDHLSDWRGALNPKGCDYPMNEGSIGAASRHSRILHVQGINALVYTRRKVVIISLFIRGSYSVTSLQVKDVGLIPRPRYICYSIPSFHSQLTRRLCPGGIHSRLFCLLPPFFLICYHSCRSTSLNPQISIAAEESRLFPLCPNIRLPGVVTRISLEDPSPRQIATFSSVPL